MRIGIVTSFAAKQPAGLERFLLDLLQALENLSGVDYVVYTKKGAGLADALNGMGIKNIPVVEVGFGKLWKDIGLFLEPRADAYIFNGPIVPAWFTPKNYFVILQDFAYRHIQPRSWREKLKRIILDVLTRLALQRAKKIITVSETTKQELIRLFGIRPELAVTIYPGFRRLCDIFQESVAGVSQPYFLYIGTLKERKNVLSVIKAFSQYKKDMGDRRQLVIAGKHNQLDPYVKKLHKLIEQEGIASEVVFTGLISDGQVSWLYQHAEALVFPSLLEGFGLPILEAMSCKIPVITSSTGSLAEVAGSAALLVNPLGVDEIAAGMKRIVSDSELRAKLVAAGLDRLQIFSWSKTARELEQLVISNLA